MLSGGLIFVAFVLLLGLIAWLFFELKKKGSGGDEQLGAVLERLKILGEQNRELRDAMDSKLSETHRATRDHIHQTFQTVEGITGQSAKLITDVTDKLAKLEKTNEQVIGFPRSSKVFRTSSRIRSSEGFGEYFLEETLKNVLPPNSYKMQYEFKDGNIVDAVVFVKEKIIPVDSKFSLENYERIINCSSSEEREKLEKLFKQDLKNRIDETSKYIKPSEGTMDFAFMFIPSEAIYYDLLVNKVGAVQVNTKDLIEYAFKDKKVIIVSPTSFLAYLQTVLQGLRALQIEESAKEIRTNVEKLGKHMAMFDKHMNSVHNSLGTTVNQFNIAYKELGKIDKDVVKITDSEKTIEPLVLDKPKEE